MTKHRTWVEWRIVPPEYEPEYLPFYETFQTRKGARIYQNGNPSLQEWRIIKVKVTEA